jgi:secreted PhoX family phosphatase
VIAADGRAVVYSGDDSRFEYVYKFVSARPWHPHARQANLDLLDEGTLYAAQFKADGTGQWLPLIWSATPNDPANPLNPANGFNSQAEVLIDARRAGDLVGATPMDRPEDLETDPVTGKVYLVMTNNSQRSGGNRQADGHAVVADADAANPRQPNHNGHIIELTEAGGNAAAARFGWEIFMLCGNPKDAAGKLLTSLGGTPLADQDTYFAGYAEAEAISPIATPDNITFDRDGNLWIATDGQPESIAINDGIFAVPTQGPQRGQVRQFLSGPKGCEICGPLFTPDSETLFVNIQHPGEGGSLAQPISDWPDRAGKPPRPSVVTVRKVSPGPKQIGSGALESVSWLDRWKDH